MSPCPAAGTVMSKTKVHVTIGHATVMAELLVFGVPNRDGDSAQQALEGLTRRIGSLAVKVRHHPSRHPSRHRMSVPHMPQPSVKKKAQGLLCVILPTALNGKSSRSVFR